MACGCGTARPSGTATGGPFQGRGRGARRAVAGRPGAREHGLSRHTHIISHGGGTLATVEAGRCRMSCPMSPHHRPLLTSAEPCPAASPRTPSGPRHRRAARHGELLGLGPRSAVVVHAAGKVMRTTRSPSWTARDHDFALTGSYVVLLDLPVTLSLDAVGAGKSCRTWEPGAPGPRRPAVRDGSSSAGSDEPCWVFHCLNAYDDPSGQVVVDVCRYNEPLDVSTLGPVHGPVTLDRWIIDPAAGKVAQPFLDDRGQEFPGSMTGSSPGRTATATARSSARTRAPSPRPGTSPTTRSPTRCSGTT